MKLEPVLETRLSDAVTLIERVKDLSNRCGSALSSAIKNGKQKESVFCATALQFNRINYEAIDCIFHALKAGHIAESYVLLRWHLELGHLYYYLWENESEYRKWLSGEEIRPATIGRFFEEKGLATWRDAYSDWSNVTHANSVYIENSGKISRMSPVSEDQILTLTRALIGLLYTANKINNVSGNLLKALLGVSVYNPIAQDYNALEEDIICFSGKHVSQ